MNWKRIEWSKVLMQGVMTAGTTAVPFVLFDLSFHAKTLWAVTLSGLVAIIFGMINTPRRR